MSESTGGADLELIEMATGQPATGPRTILVHGALDQHKSFNRAARRLVDRHVVSYDRRGYGRSVGLAPAVDIYKHASDLVKLAGDDRPVVIGHSVGGLVALTAAALFPNAFSAVGAYESPYRWKSWWPVHEDPTPADNPARTVEQFYRGVMGDRAWERGSDSLRAALAAQGPALEVDLAIGLEGPVFELGEIVVPVRLAHGSASPAKYMRSAAEMANDLAECDITVIEGASHGAHLSHPDAFADFIEKTIHVV